MKLSNLILVFLAWFTLFQVSHLMVSAPHKPDAPILVSESNPEPPQTSKGAVRFSRQTARWQKDSPVQLVTVGGQAPDHLNAIVLNTGNQTVRSLRLGCYLKAKAVKAKSQRPFLFMHTKDIDVNLEPGQVAAIITPKWIVDKKESFKFAPDEINDVVAVYGIVGAKYEGKRSPFKYNLLRNRSFSSMSSQRIEALYRSVYKEGRLEEPLATLDSAPGLEAIGPSPRNPQWECYPAADTNCRLGGGGSTCSESQCGKNNGPCRHEACRELPQPPPRNPGSKSRWEYCPLSNYPTMCFSIF